MRLFHRQTAEESDTAERLRQDKKAAHLAKTRAKTDAKQAKHDAYMEKTGRPVSHAAVSRERFAIDVTENLTSIGGALGGGRRGALRYRVVVTDTETGRPQHVTQTFSYKLAYADGERYVNRLVSGAKKVK